MCGARIFLYLRYKTASKYLAITILLQQRPEFYFNRLMHRSLNYHLMKQCAEYLTEFNELYTKWLNGFVSGGKRQKSLILIELAQKFGHSDFKKLPKLVIKSNSAKLAEFIWNLCNPQFGGLETCWLYTKIIASGHIKMISFWHKHYGTNLCNPYRYICKNSEKTIAYLATPQIQKKMK